ncbi:MAG: hypothetical protein IKX14_07400 [Neisseriaceae bacterium]|nr:hypothetical protein [Neisseriaceae bacterium]
MNTLHFILDGWDLLPEWRQFPEHLPTYQTPTLNSLRRFGACQKHAHNLMQFSFSGSLKALILQDLDLPPDTPSYLAAPTSQFMDMHSMQVISGEDLQLSWTDAHQACRVLNDFVANDGWQFHPYHADLWLVTVPQNQDWQAADIWTIDNRLDASHTIEGKNARPIRTLLTEIQMLLFSKNIRQNNNLPPINGIWLWQDTQGVALDNTTVIGNALWLPEKDNLLINQDFSWDDILRLAENKPHITLYNNQAKQHLQQGGLPQHADFIQQFDKNILNPAHTALKQGNLKKLIITGTEHTYTLNAKSHWRFWKRKQEFKGAI